MRLRFSLPAAITPVGLLASILLVGLAGCAPQRTIAPVAAPVVGLSPAEADARAERVRRDPLAYVQRVAENCRHLQQYTVTFTRQERRGLGFFKTLHEPERILCKFRRRPFSVYMKWLDPDIKYGETTYVEGQQNNQVRFIPRHGLFGLPPTVTRIDPQTAVIWGEAVYPITEFGLERMMDRTLRNVERSRGECGITYLGLTQISEVDRPVHDLRLEFPTWQFRAPIQELFVDAETDLPVCTRVLTASGRLERAYVWQDVNPNVTLTDDDFVLEAERQPRRGASQ